MASKKKKCPKCNKLIIQTANFCMSHRVITKIHKRKMSIAKAGVRNPMWCGDKVGLKALHEWIKNHKLKPQFCEKCKITPPYDLANISQQYKRDINDFEWLCRKCHMQGDGRMKNLEYIRLKRLKYNGQKRKTKNITAKRRPSPLFPISC